MNRHAWAASICLGLAPALAPAQDAMGIDEIGKQEYMAACAGCHGESGKGDGPIAQLIEIQTPDLTTIRQRMEMADDDFPYRNTLMLIDGRNAIRAHGSDMPVWGERYSSRGIGHWFRGPDAETRELAALGRMLALVYYIESIQE